MTPDNSTGQATGFSGENLPAGVDAKSGSTPDAAIPPGEPLATRLAAIREAENPLLEAARPLLRALADMPDKLEPHAVNQLHLMLRQEVNAFVQLCEQADIRHNHMIGARYSLCTALDEAAGRTGWGQRDTGVEWLRKGLATEFHGDREGGDKVYLLIGRLMNEPREHLDLIEVLYRILSLGFMGRYQHEADGARRHEVIRQRLYNEIQSQRGAVPLALSPHAQSDVQPRRMSFYDVPVWLTFLVLGLILLALFGWFKYQLLNHSEAVEKQIADIGRLTPPPPAPRVLHLKELLASEIAAGTVSVDEDAHHSSVTFRGDSMFKPGGVSIDASMQPLIAKIAGEVVKVPGKVSVTGYTDNVPIKSRQFASNDALSLERATQVMQMLQTAGVPAGRLEAIGKGEADPVGDNTTAQGRAQNRRVQITVTP
ncbi:type VI secretion system protein TssL, long form [Paraburkholderia adhaesiva]|uniref:type VI secretion system protein TssL, long form n=1 Tax=Paraburkholderia adhaesiva TaxID=2883244 RepID=UPI001F2FEB39|nr:type VI secretion system protein TssL, long form [Paraburkholderia adhaesiva]